MIIRRHGHFARKYSIFYLEFKFAIPEIVSIRVKYLFRLILYYIVVPKQAVFFWGGALFKSISSSIVEKQIFEIAPNFTYSPS